MNILNKLLQKNRAAKKYMHFIKFQENKKSKPNKKEKKKRRSV
jgi:hypothetical protein